VKQADVRSAAEQVARVLREAGFQALFAGGCVRDLLLGLAPKDYDVATNATPENVAALFRRTELVGAKFGVVIVRLRGAHVEVATFRTDGDYRDGRRPDSVRYATAEEDARRRDFTINGMFLDPQDGRVMDLVGGQEDLRQGIVRAIGVPEHRFAEDHLRMLRAVRFAARFGFSIEAATLEAIRQNAPAIGNISPERIQQELEHIIGAPGRERGWALLMDSRLIDHVLPGRAWTPETLHDVTLRLAGLPQQSDFMLGLAAVLAAFGPAAAAQLCRALRCSVAMERGVAWLIESLPRMIAVDRLDMADVKMLMADPRFERLMLLVRAEAIGVRRSPEASSRIEERTRTIPRERVAPPPLVGGEDLQALNIAPGPIYRRVLDATYRAQLNEVIHTREEALALAKKLLQEPAN
jgi:tRNA nucleotidyltransferase/poly(A) polymerase